MRYDISSNNLMDSRRATWVNVSSKLTPSIWVYPRDTNWALFLVKLPFSSDMFLYIHLVPMMLIELGWGTNSRLCFSQIKPVLLAWHLSNTHLLSFFNIFGFNIGDKTHIHNHFFGYDDIPLIDIPNHIFYRMILLNSCRWSFFLLEHQLILLLNLNLQVYKLCQLPC